MKFVQKTYLEVEKDGKLVQLVVDADMPLGLIFDALMELKGYAVERMARAHEVERAEAEEKMGDEVEDLQEEIKEE